MYTKETLTPLNSRYLGEHFLSDQDVAKVNALVAEIEAARAAQPEGHPVPLNGDLVICELPDGQAHDAHAHLETVDWFEPGQLTVCVHLYGAPFIEPGQHPQASGGPWIAPQAGELQYVGRVQKAFWTWGHFGPYHDGGVEFQAQVNAWKIVAEHRRFV